MNKLLVAVGLLIVCLVATSFAVTTSAATDEPETGLVEVTITEPTDVPLQGSIGVKFVVDLGDSDE